MTKRNLFKSFAILGTVGPLMAAVVSCSTNPTDKSNFIVKNKIVIASAIPKTWPQYGTFKKIIEDYNKNHKDEDGFMEVVFMSSSETKTESYNELSSQINKLIKAKSSNVPNVLIANFTEAFELAGLNKILQLDKSVDFDGDGNNDNAISQNIFKPTFVTGRTNLNKKHANGLWATPFTVTTNNSLGFNLPVMKVLINLMKNHGASVSNNDPFITKILSNKNSISKYDDVLRNGMVKPSTLWVDGNASDKTSLNGYIVNDKTFKTYDKLYEFSQKAIKALKLKHSPYIAYKYFGNDFFNILDSNTGANANTFSLFRKDQNGKYIFPFMTSGSSDEKMVKQTFEQMHNVMKNGFDASANAFMPWKNGQHAFATIPSVSARYSYKSNIFGAYTNDGFAFEDIAYLQSPTRNSVLFDTTGSKLFGITPSTIGSYSLAESDFIGIKKSEKENKAVIKFLNFVYKGKMKDGTNVHEYLSKESGYIVPVASASTTVTALQKLYDPTDVNDKEHRYAASYRSLINSYKLIEDSQSKYRTFEGDQYTGKLLTIIRGILKKVVEKPSEWNAQKFIDEIKKHKSEFNI